MEKTKWMVAQKKADFKALSEKYNIDPVIARIIRNRNLSTEEEYDMFLNGDMSMLHDPLGMKDMREAVEILREKISSGKSIRIIGDYDVDGICATFILLRSIRALGGTVDTVIPNRITDGYGLNESMIDAACNDGIDTILTCDNGIAAFTQIQKAKDLGMTVVVTDHHEVPFEEKDGEIKYILPPADAVVDPKRADCFYPYSNICGAFIAFKLASLLLDGDYPLIIEELIPFAAMATVCDVMDLLDENRIIVKEGIRLMEAEPINVGLKALVIATGLSQKKITSFCFGFVLGPTINATGRLDTAQRAMSLFDAADFKEAAVIATELKQLNDERKKLTEDGVAMAIETIEASEAVNDRVLVVYLNGIHESLAGIIAGRIKEKYYKPTIVLTDAEEGIKGSARSIESYDMFAKLSEVKDLFTKFGGHKMAAGLSLASLEDVEKLRYRLNERCELSDADLTQVVHVDMAMPLSYADFRLVKSMDVIEPTGTANPRPLFATANISLISYEKKGKNRVIGKFVVADETGRKYDVISFEDMDQFDSFIIEKFGREKYMLLCAGRLNVNDMVIKMVYYPDINEFNNRVNLQHVMKYVDV